MMSPHAYTALKLFLGCFTFGAILVALKSKVVDPNSGLPTWTGCVGLDLLLASRELCSFDLNVLSGHMEHFLLF
jgi:hypothetical protein